MHFRTLLDLLYLLSFSNKIRLTSSTKYTTSSTNFYILSTNLVSPSSNMTKTSSGRRLFPRCPNAMLSVERRRVVGELCHLKGTIYIHTQTTDSMDNGASA